MKKLLYELSGKNRKFLIYWKRRCLINECLQFITHKRMKHFSKSQLIEKEESNWSLKLGDLRKKRGQRPTNVNRPKEQSIAQKVRHPSFKIELNKWQAFFVGNYFVCKLVEKWQQWSVYCVPQEIGFPQSFFVIFRTQNNKTRCFVLKNGNICAQPKEQLETRNSLLNGKTTNYFSNWRTNNAIVKPPKITTFTPTDKILKKSIWTRLNL